jgi:RNA polymerase sigma-70 factor (ECF subfamily)
VATTVVAAFSASLPRGVGPVDRELLAPALEAATARGASAHPGVVVSAVAFARALGAHAGREPDPIAALETLHTDDLYLTTACLAGDGAALETLERLVRSTVPAAVSRLRLDASTVSDVEQLVRQRLLVPPSGGPPKLHEYGGRGALKQWLRAVALRVALNHLDGRRPEDSLDAEGAPVLAAAGPDPEMALLKQHARDEFKAVLQEVLTGLPPHERSLLRLYFLQGLTVEQIGRMEGTHKSTVSRWLTRTRATVLAEVQRRLGERLRLEPGEYDSLLGLLRSQLSLSLHRVLNTR